MQTEDCFCHPIHSSSVTEALLVLSKIPMHINVALRHERLKSVALLA